MLIKSYKDLTVWQKAMHMVGFVYDATERFPAAERFGLSSQMQRAAVSVPANIAEGYGRGTRNDYAHFIDISHGSVAELETLISLAHSRKYMSTDTCSTIEEQLDEIGKMLRSLRKSLRER